MSDPSLCQNKLCVEDRAKSQRRRAQLEAMEQAVGKRNDSLATAHKLLGEALPFLQKHKLDLREQADYERFEEIGPSAALVTAIEAVTGLIERIKKELSDE